ncbi:Target of rapamycin complex 2 subunit sin1 [Fusarium oxysporum f. sp. albedinis]|nr:Target of rapamycin complex 2 subunit sin1 [Fusarium oxysporum f. sp. albedinis]
MTKQLGLGDIYTRCTVYDIWHWYRGSSSLTDINLKHEYLGTGPSHRQRPQCNAVSQDGRHSMAWFVSNCLGLCP